MAAGVRCAIDISDGLIADLEHICDASGVSAEIGLPELPVSPLLKEVFPDTWRGLALSGGEDYELLFTAPAELIESTGDLAGVPVSVIGVIGHISESITAPHVSVMDENGRPIPVDSGGWNHLRE